LSKKKGNSPQKNNRLPNHERLRFYGSIVFTVLCIIVILGSPALPRSYGPAATLLAILLGLTACICIFIFKKRSNMVVRALEQPNSTLFTYTADDWYAFRQQDAQLRKEEKFMIFLFLSGLTVIIFIPFTIIVQEPFMLVVMLLLISMYALLGLAYPRLKPLLIRKQEGSVLILERGVYIEGYVHTWEFPLSKLLSKKWKEQPFPHVAISYEFFDRLGPRSYTVRIPIPARKASFEQAIKRLK
jgi:hypothetical protein